MVYAFPAVSWVQRYLDEVRPDLEHGRSHPALFLSVTGGAIAPDVMSRLVSAYVQAAVPSKKGSCHLFRHTAATLMLEAGADVRFIAEMLGHQKLETTMTYTRVSMVKLQEVYARCHPAEKPRKASRDCTRCTRCTRFTFRVLEYSCSKKVLGSRERTA